MTEQSRTAPQESSQAPSDQPSQPERPKIKENRDQPTFAEAGTIERAAAVPSITPGDSISINPQLLADWQAPIDFYGKVIDENSNAVASANIHFRWFEIPAKEGERTLDTQSDPQGLFSLQAKRGPSLTVSFSKEGYYSSGNAQKGFNFALGPDIISPDPQNPVVFTLRKKGQGVELLTSENGIRPSLAIRVPKDSTPVRVDFFQRQVTSDGQFEISQSKPPWKAAMEWSFRMSLTRGGFVETEDEFRFEAPDTNYLPAVDYRFAKNETNWTTHVVKNFYIAFGQPRRYGWLRLESDLAQETIFLTYAVNPSGSRNLEPTN